MTSERNNIEFSMWRKKVDKSLLIANSGEGTTVPIFFTKMWGFDKQIGKVTKKGESASTYVNIAFTETYRNNYKNKYKRELPELFPGFVTYLKGRNEEGGTDRASGAYRFWLGTPPHDILKYEVHHKNLSKNFNVKGVFEDADKPDLPAESPIAYLRPVFAMSYIRALESSIEKKKDKLSKKPTSEPSQQSQPHLDFMKRELNKMRDQVKNLKKEKFWEFLDIEYDSENNTFILVPHYTIKPIFPNVIQELIDTTTGSRLLNRAEGNNPKPEYSSWKPRDNYHTEIIPKNLIYFLADTNHKLFYVGETKRSGVQRWSQEYPEIPDWNFYKYIELPNSIDDKTRVIVQDILIHAFASVLEEKKKPENVKTLDSHLSKGSSSFSNYKLANLDIKN